MRLTLGVMIGMLLLPVVVFAAEPATPDAKTEDTTKAALDACQQRVKATEAILVGVAQGIQNEMELAHYRLNASKQAGTPQ